MKSPAGSVVNWLLPTVRYLNALSPLKSPSDTVVNRLMPSPSHSNALSPLKSPSGSVVKALPRRSSRSNALSPSKSPLRRAEPLNAPLKFVPAKSTTKLSPVISPKWAMVTAAQSSTPSIAATMASRTPGVRPQTLVMFTSMVKTRLAVSASTSVAVHV